MPRILVHTLDDAPAGTGDTLTKLAKHAPAAPACRAPLWIALSKRPEHMASRAGRQEIWLQPSGRKRLTSPLVCRLLSVVGSGCGLRVTDR
jgi:hypothetical protein